MKYSEKAVWLNLLSIGVFQLLLLVRLNLSDCSQILKAGLRIKKESAKIKVKTDCLTKSI